MYALTCPGCNDVRHVPFVRAGAVTRCPVCQHQWSIKDRQVVREDRRTGPRPVPPVVVVSEQLDDDPKGGSSMTGLSGLSDLMQDVPKPVPKPVPTLDPALAGAPAQVRAAPQPAAFSPEAARPSTARAAGLGPRAWAGLAVGVAVLLLLLWMVLGGGDAPLDAPVDAPSPDAAAVANTPADQDADKDAAQADANDSNALDPTPGPTTPVGPPMPDEAPATTPSP